MNNTQLSDNKMSLKYILLLSTISCDKWNCLAATYCLQGLIINFFITKMLCTFVFHIYFCMRPLNASYHLRLLEGLCYICTFCAKNVSYFADLNIIEILCCFLFAQKFEYNIHEISILSKVAKYYIFEHKINLLHNSCHQYTTSNNTSVRSTGKSDNITKHEI